MRPKAGGTYTDQDLVEGCRAGKPALQRALYERFAGKMLAVAQRYCQDRMEAEDVLHMAFMKVFTRMDSFRGGVLEGWIRTICVREAINHYHSKKRKPVSYGIEESYQGEEVPAEALSVLSLQDLHRLVGSLPEGARLVFNLFAVEGFDHAEIADMLGVSVGTTKSQLSRARKLLQEKLVATERP